MRAVDRICGGTISLKYPSCFSLAVFCTFRPYFPDFCCTFELCLSWGLLKFSSWTSRWPSFSPVIQSSYGNECLDQLAWRQSILRLPLLKTANGRDAFWSLILPMTYQSLWHKIHEDHQQHSAQCPPAPKNWFCSSLAACSRILLLAHFVLLVSPDWPSVVSLWSASVLANLERNGILKLKTNVHIRIGKSSLCVPSNWKWQRQTYMYIERERELFLHVPFWTAQAIPLQQSWTGTNPEMHQLLHLLIMSWTNVSAWKVATSSLEEAVTFKARSQLLKQEWAAWALSRQASTEVTPSKILISAPPMWWQQRCSNKHEVWPCNCFAPSSVIIVECSSCGNDARTCKGGGAESSKTVWTWNLLNWKWLWLWWLEQWVQVFSLQVLRTKPCWVNQGHQSWHKAAWNKSGNKRIAHHDGFHPLPTVCVAERAWRRSCCKTLAASFGCRYIPCRGKKKGWKESYSRTWSTRKCRSLK